MKINKDQDIKIEDADFEDLQSEEQGESKDSPSVLFEVLLKDIVENKDGEEIKYKIASFNSVDDHPFNYEFVGSILQLVLSSYVSFTPEEDRVNFATMSVKTFLDLLNGGEKNEDQEEDDFIPDQPEHDGN